MCTPNTHYSKSKTNFFFFKEEGVNLSLVSQDCPALDKLLSWQDPAHVKLQELIPEDSQQQITFYLLFLNKTQAF